MFLLSLPPPPEPRAEPLPPCGHHRGNIPLALRQLRSLALGRNHPSHSFRLRKIPAGVERRIPGGLKHVTRGIQRCSAAGQVLGRFSHQAIAGGHGARPFTRRQRGGNVRFLPDRAKKVMEVEELHSTTIAL